MHVKPSDFGITPRAVLDTLKLISISRREVLNIVNVVDCDAPGNATALDRNSFAGMKNALMVYEVFLCGAGFPFAQNDKVNAAYAELNQAWSKLVQTVCRHCTDKKVAKRLSVAWSAAIEELCAILERAKAKTIKSTRKYKDFVSALDRAAEAMGNSNRTIRALGSDNGELSPKERKQHDWRTIRRICENEMTSAGMNSGTGITEAARRAEKRGLLVFYKNARSAASAYSQALGKYHETMWNKMALPDDD